MDRWLKETPAEEPWNNIDKSSTTTATTKSTNNKKGGKKEDRNGGMKEVKKEKTWRETGVDGSASERHY